MRRTELRAASRALPAADELLADPRQRLDTLAKRLPRALHANAQLHRTHLTRAAARLTPRLLKLRLARSSEIVVTLEQRGKRARAHYLQRRWDRVRSAEQLLKAFSYQGVLARGFALVRDGEGHPLRTAAAVAGGMRLEIEFSDGRVGATADGDGAPPPAKPKAAPARRRNRRAGQSVRNLGRVQKTHGLRVSLAPPNRLSWSKPRRRTSKEAPLLNRYDRSLPMNGEAEIKYLDGDFRVVRPGAFVRCAVTGVPIPLEELKYWSVDRQEAYASPQAVLQRLRPQAGK